MLRERSAGTGDRQIRYLEAGSGWPAVLIHGFPLSADMWIPQLEAVPRGWRFLAPDLKGFGPAPGAPAESLDDMARGVVDLLDELEIERAVIGGLSMGGYVTLALFRMAPERFTGVILASTRAAADTDQGREGRDRMSALVRAQGASAVADAMLPTLLGRTTRTSRPEVEPAVRRLIEGNTAAGLDAAIGAMTQRRDATPLLADIGRPALVMTGDEDVLIPRTESEDIHRLLPRSHLVVLPRAGHLSNMESPADFSEALGNFLHSNL